MRNFLLIYFLLLSVVFSLSSAYSQSSLYMPIEYRQAYENGTRSWDGTVSENYRQNTASYDLKARLIQRREK